jgi:hypothetical protein
MRQLAYLPCMWVTKILLNLLIRKPWDRKIWVCVPSAQSITANRLQFGHFALAIVISAKNNDVRQDEFSRLRAVAVHALDIIGPPPEQVPRNVIETGFISSFQYFSEMEVRVRGGQGR